MKVLSRKYYVYRHIRPDKKEVFYIGLGCYQKKGKYNRAGTTKNRNRHWLNIVNLCNGIFEVQILCDNLTKEEAVSKECEFIKLYGRVDLHTGTLCNLTDGGEGVNGLSEESKRKIGNANRGVKSAMFGKKQSPEWIEKMRLRMTGINNPNYGKPLPEYQKVINRKTHLGKKQSKETIEKRIIKLKKKILNLETGYVFESVTACSVYYGKSDSQITRDIKQNKLPLKFL